MAGVFISYRREDSDDAARQIAARLAARLGGDNVFLDVVSLPPGERYAVWLNERVKACSALLVVIGKRWISLFGDANDPEDWVRREIEIAAKAEVPIIPVLADGAAFPSRTELPESIRQAFVRQALVVDNDFDSAMARLIDILTPIAASDTGPALIEAVALKGRITGPAPMAIDPQAASGSSGKRFSIHPAYNLSGIVSHEGARSEVEGQPGTGRVRHETTVTVSLDRLNILNVVAADRVVVKAHCRMFRDGQEATISLEGSTIENLRVADHEVSLAGLPTRRIPTLEHFGQLYRTDQGFVKALNAAGFDRELKPRRARFGDKLPLENGAVNAPLLAVSGIERSGSADRITVDGNRILIYEFGRIVIGQAAFSGGRRSVTMLAVEFDASSTGRIEVGQVSIVAP